MKNIVSSRRQPHSPLDNVNTPYNPIRLLKGAPPGQEAVNHYISELSIEKSNNSKLADKQRKHLVKRQSTTTFQNFPLRNLTTQNWPTSRGNTWSRGSQPLHFRTFH